MHRWLLTVCLIILSGCAEFNSVEKEQFVVGQETVLDKKTDLMWAATDSRGSLTWQEAVDYCTAYTGGGFQDWRMPRKTELQTLIESKIEKDGEVINLSSNLVWASETEDSKGAYCNFKARGCFWMEQVISISLRALPVRDTKAGTAALSGPPPASIIPPQSMEQRLQILDLLHKQQLITDDEYNRKKSAILDKL
jgi:Protein of unknown function (DUF1566)